MNTLHQITGAHARPKFERLKVTSMESGSLDEPPLAPASPPTLALPHPLTYQDIHFGVTEPHCQ